MASSPNTRHAIMRIKELPTLPTVLGKVLATASDPDASALDLGRHISADQSLAATLLKLVNSAYYGYYRQIKSVTQAIVVLGFLEVRNIALTATAFGTFARGNSDYDRLQLWRHSLAAAMAAELCAKRIGMSPDGCFEAGLLHDIGKVALDMLYPEEFLTAAHRAHAARRPMHEMEREIFGLDHAEAGGVLSEHWNLPPEVVDAIRCHHNPKAAKRFPKIAALTAFANLVAYRADLGELSNVAPPEFPAEAGQALGFEEAWCNELAETLAGNRKKIDEFLGALEEAC